MKKLFVDDKKIIIRLIRDHLISTKLLSGLDALGLNAGDYNLYLGDTIFLLMGFEACERNDLIFEKIFLASSEKVIGINFSSDTEDLDKLSKEIYEELLFAKDIVMDLIRNSHRPGTISIKE